MKKIKTYNLLPRIVLCVIVFTIFIFTSSKLSEVSLPSGYASLFFAGATDLLRGAFDVVSTHPFSVLTGALSFMFSLDVMPALKLSASLITALASVAFYLNTKALGGDNVTSLLTSSVGALVILSLAWAGDYHSILGLVLFMILTRQLVLYLKENKIKTLLPLIAISVLFLIDFLLASALLVMLVVCFAYLLVIKNRLSTDLISLATVLFFLGLTLYGINKEWLTITSTVMFKSSFPSAFPEETWKSVPIMLSFLGTLISLVYFYLEKRFNELVIGQSLTILGVCTIFVNTPYALTLLLPLALLPLKLLRQSYSINKEFENEEEIIVLNLEGDKFFSALLSAITLISLFNYGYYIAMDAPISYINDKDLSSLMNVIDWMKANLTEPGLVATPTYLAPLFEGFLGSRVLSWRSPQDPLLTNAINDTCFRLLTPYLLVDELEPLSTSKAPLISAFDGNQYIPLLCVDDSYVRLRETSDGITFFESPYGATFSNYNITENEDFLELEMEFVTSNVRILKTIRASKNEPLMTITYTATNRTDVHIEDFTLPFWVVWGKGIANSAKSGTKVFLVLGHPQGQYSLELDFKDASSEPLIARSETGQEFVRGFFVSEENEVYAEVEIKATFSSPNQIRPSFFSVFDLQKTQDVSYVLVTNSSPIISGTLEREYEIFRIDDSFVEFAFTYDNWDYKEAPAYGKVTEETVSNENNTRNVTYETTGLIIRKDLAFTTNNLTLIYYVEAANSSDPKFQGLLNATLEIWLPWERSAKSWNYNGTEASVSLDISTLNLNVYGDLANFSVGPHPEYGQWRIFLAFNLFNSGTTIYNATIGLSLTCNGKDMTMTYVPTTRPLMNGSDSIRFNIELKPFEELCSRGRYVLLEVSVD